MHFHVWLRITLYKIATFESLVEKAFHPFPCSGRQSYNTISQQACVRSARPIDWRCWWIACEVQQAILPCSVCRPVGWTAPIRPDIKKTLLDHIRGSSLIPFQWWGLWEALFTETEEEQRFWPRLKWSWTKKSGEIFTRFNWLLCYCR